jgi:hypothetical protein
VRVLCTISYVFAKLVSEGTSALLGNTSTFLKEKSGMNFDVANVLKKVTFAFIFVPVLIVALETLQIRSIAVPATNMLNDMMAVIPKIIAAVVILTVFYIVGKFVTGLIVLPLWHLVPSKILRVISGFQILFITLFWGYS